MEVFLHAKFQASRLAPRLGGSCSGGTPCIASAPSFLAVSYAPQVVHVMTPSAGLALVVRVPSPVVAVVTHAAEDGSRREVLVVGGRCGRVWTVDVDRLTSMQGSSSGGRKRRRTHGADRLPNFRTEEGRGDNGGGVRLVVLRPTAADMEHPGLRFALSLGVTRGLLFAGLLNPATHVCYPRTAGKPLDASAVCGLSGELASAFLTVTPATATAGQSAAFATDRALMTKDFSVALFGVDAALSGSPLVVQSDASGELFWWPAPERPTRAERVTPPHARRLSISGYAPFACPVLSILPLVPPPDTCAASPPVQCCGLLLVGSSGECRLLTLDAHIPWDGRRRAASQLSPGAKTLNPAKNLVCVDISLAGPVGAVSAVPGSVVHTNVSTGQVMCTAAFAEQDGKFAGVTKPSDQKIVLDRALSTPLPFAHRAVALGTCSASHHSTGASTSPTSPTSLVVVTDQGDVFGIKAHDLKHVASALWQFESPNPGRRVSTPPSDGDNDASSGCDGSSDFPDTALESTMLGSEQMLPIRRLRGPVAVQCRLEERLAMLRENAAKAASARARRGTGIAALVEVGMALDLAARVAQKVRGLNGSNDRGKRRTLDRRRQGWRCKSVLAVRGFSHEARVVDLDDTTRRGFRSCSGGISHTHAGCGTADREIFIRVTITADAATAELLSDSRCWSYTMNVSLDAPATCNRLPQHHFAVSTAGCGYAVAIGPFRQIYRQEGSTEDFAWDICLPLRSSLLSSCFHLPIKLSFGLTSAYRRGCAWSERDDFSITLGNLKLDPLSLILRRPQVIIDASPAGLRRGALCLRSAFMSTAVLNGRLVPFDLFRVPQQVRMTQPARADSSMWMQLQDALNAFDVSMDIVQLGSGDRSAILQAGPCDIAVISFVDYNSNAAGTKTASVDIQSTSRSLLAAIIDAIGAVDEPTFHRNGVISVRLEPVRSKIRELGRKVGLPQVCSRYNVYQISIACSMRFFTCHMQMVVSSMSGKLYRQMLARELFDAYMAIRAATGA